MSLMPLIDRLAAFDFGAAPVVSLYLNAEPDQHGRDRDRILSFVRKELADRIRTYPQRSSDRESLEADKARIERYLHDELERSANGVAIFACAAADNFFEVAQVGVPLLEDQLFVGAEPHLYPLARLHDQHPRHAALLLDTNSARLLVFSLGQAVLEKKVEGAKTRRSTAGAWSQARYQRHIENYHLQHIKEVVEALDRVVREEGIEHVVLGCDDAALPLVREQMPAGLQEKVVDVLRLDMKTPQHEVLARSLDALREQDARDDREKVARLFDAYRAGGLGVVGVEATRVALEIGQVDELLISAAPTDVQPESAGAGPGQAGRAVAAAAEGGAAGVASAAGLIEPAGGESDDPTAAAEALVRLAQKTSAAVTFIEEPALLAEIGGVGAFLRYRVEGPQRANAQASMPQRP
jgi:peptide chain release factor subunit 1